MPFGVPPKYSEQISMGNNTREQLLTLAIEAVEKIGWNIGHVSESGFAAYTGMSLASYGEELIIEINDSGLNIKSACTGTQVHDMGKNRKNVKKFIAAFLFFRENDMLFELERKHGEYMTKYNIATEMSDTVLSEKHKKTGFLTIFKPVAGYFVTPILVNLNILVYVLMVIAGVNFFLPDNESLLRWGADFRPLTLDGQWWRLLTCCFIHIGILHLLFNMYALVYIGLLLEPILGKRRFLIAYLLTGILSSLASLSWHSYTICAGASGAIFGMYGVFLALLTTNFIEKSARKSLLTSIGIFVAYNLMNGMKGGIDNAAHIGGLISGMVIGYAFIPGLKKSENRNLDLALTGSVVVISIIATVFVLLKTPNDFSTYQKNMDRFTELEKQALHYYDLQDANERKTFLVQKGIECWRQAVKTIEETEKLDLTDNIHSRNKLLLEYSQARLDLFIRLANPPNNDDQGYYQDIEGMNKNIKSILDRLKEQGN